MKPFIFFGLFIFMLGLICSGIGLYFEWTFPLAMGLFLLIYPFTFWPLQIWIAIKFR